MSLEDKMFMALGVLCLLSVTAKAQPSRLPVLSSRANIGTDQDRWQLDDTAWKKAPLVGDFVNTSDGF